MTVKRIVTDVAATQVDAAQAFYGDVLGLDLIIYRGSVLFFAAGGASATPRISIASEGGSGTPVPDIAIEVDDLHEVLRRVAVPGPAVERVVVREALLPA